MATYYLVSTALEVPGVSGVLFFRPANSDGTPTGQPVESTSVVNDQIIETPYGKKYIIKLTTGCELHRARVRTDANGNSVWAPYRLICNGNNEALVRYA